MMLSGRIRGLVFLARAWWAPHANVSRLRFRVMPTDVDLNVHLTNSRYPQLMDIGRMDMLVRSGTGKIMHQAGIAPVLVESNIAFKRDLPLGVGFTLETRVIGRDRKALVVEQRFLVGDAVHAIGTVKMVCVLKGKVVEPSVFASLIEAAEADQVQGSARRAAQ